MKSKTKIQIVNDAFTELRISGITANADNKDIELALNRLEDYIAQLTFDIGFRFETTPNPNTVSGIPDYANLAIALGLALNLAPAYGKAPEALIRQTSAAMNTLIGRCARPRRVAYPNRQPLGMGNKRVYPMYAFMPEAVIAPNSPQTEDMSLGDIKKFVLNFSADLPLAASISAYTTSLSSGIVISSVSQSLMTISFTIQATEFGYQQILFSVIANNGEKTNRTLDFNITDPSSIRANP